MSIHIEDYDELDAKALEYADMVSDDLTANSVAYRLFLTIFDYERYCEYDPAHLAEDIRRDPQRHRIATRVIYAAIGAGAGFKDVLIGGDSFIKESSMVSWIASVSNPGGGAGAVSRNVAYKMVLAYLDLKEPLTEEYFIYGLTSSVKIKVVCAAIEASCLGEYRNLRENTNFCGPSEITRIVFEWSNWKKPSASSFLDHKSASKDPP